METQPTFRQLFPKLDRICDAREIRTIFKASKKEAAKIISENPDWYEFCQKLEGEINRNDGLATEILKRKFMDTSAQEIIKQSVEVEKEKRKEAREEKKRLDALETCKKMFEEMDQLNQTEGQNSQDQNEDKNKEDKEKDKTDEIRGQLTLDEVEKRLKEETSDSFQEKYKKYQDFLLIKKAQEILTELKDKNLLSVLPPARAREREFEFEVAKMGYEQGKLAIRLC